MKAIYRGSRIQAPKAQGYRAGNRRTTHLRIERKCLLVNVETGRQALGSSFSPDRAGTEPALSDRPEGGSRMGGLARPEMLGGTPLYVIDLIALVEVAVNREIVLRDPLYYPSVKVSAGLMLFEVTDQLHGATEVSAELHKCISVVVKLIENILHMTYQRSRIT